MKAIVNNRYGGPDRLELQEVDRPQVDPLGVLVRVRAASVNPLDWHIMRGLPYLVRISEGLRKPKSGLLGVDVAGIVEAVGKHVTLFKPGDEVFGARWGALAEYVCAREDRLAPKPVRLSFEQAAAVPTAGTTALQALRDKGRIRPGQKLLVNGAAGGVGTFAIQIATAAGAVVTGVCSTRNLDLVRSIGAIRVIDYTREDFALGGERYDLILDAVGNRSLPDLRRALTADGTVVFVGGAGGRWLGPLARPIRAMVLAPFVGQRLLLILARHGASELLFLKGLIDEGKLTPVIDRTYPLGEAAAAIRYLEAGHAQGKVVVTV